MTRMETMEENRYIRVHVKKKVPQENNEVNSPIEEKVIWENTVGSPKNSQHLPQGDTEGIKRAIRRMKREKKKKLKNKTTNEWQRIRETSCPSWKPTSKALRAKSREF